MVDYCPNCGNKEVEKVSDNELYCGQCDMTFTIEKGKKVKAKPSNRISQIEESVQKNVESINKVIGLLKPKNKDDKDIDFPWGKTEGSEQ